jgi:hypothetical protein
VGYSTLTADMLIDVRTCLHARQSLSCLDVQGRGPGRVAGSMRFRADPGGLECGAVQCEETRGVARDTVWRGRAKLKSEASHWACAHGTHGDFTPEMCCDCRRCAPADLTDQVHVHSGSRRVCFRTPPAPGEVGLAVWEVDGAPIGAAFENV